MTSVTDQTNIMFADFERHDYTKIAKTLTLLTDQVGNKATKNDIA
jgi:hypothetical protein